MWGKFKSLKYISLIAANWQIALGIAGLLSIVLTGTYMLGRSHGADSAMVDVAQAGQKANEAATVSAGQAAEESEIESANIGQDKESADAAIRATQSDDIKPSLASDALNCERVRRTGQNLDRFPACKSGADKSGAGAGP